MNDKEIGEFNSAKRMSDFAAANDDIIKDTAKAVSGFASLNADIAELEATGAARVSATGERSGGTAEKTAAKSELYAYVRKIAKTAKIIKAEEPDFDNKFKLERGNMNARELLDVARAFAQDLPPVAAKLKEYAVTGSPAARLNVLIERFEAARARQNTGKGGGVAATAQTGATVKRLSQTRRTLEMIVTNLLEDAGDAGKLAEWKSACRVEKAAKKSDGGDEPPPTT